MKPGDTVLIRLPQADLKVGKLRPALVLAIAPGAHADLLLAMITSRIYQAVPDFDEIISPSDVDYTTTGLKVRSVARLARIATVDPSVINARLGNVSTKRLHEIRNRLSDWLKS